MLFRAPSVCYEEVFVVKDRQDWAALSKIEHDWQSSSFFSLSITWVEILFWFALNFLDRYIRAAMANFWQARLPQWRPHQQRAPAAFYTAKSRQGLHTTYSWNIKWQKCAGMGLNGFIFKEINENIKTKKNSWEPFRSCLLNSTANPAQFGWKWAGLAVLFSR